MVVKGVSTMTEQEKEERRAKDRERKRKNKAKRDARDAYVAPDEVINAGESERRKILSQQIWWADQMGPNVEPPDEGTRVMQRLKRRNFPLFAKMLLSVLPSPPKEAPLPPPPVERTERVVIGAEMDKLRQLLSEWEGA
jgi:hypothetical protein